MSGMGHLGELEIIDYMRENFGREIYLPMKDVGIDFLLVKNKKFFKIQVKTSKFQKNSYFWFDLYEKKMIYDKNTYYIFVCKSLGRRVFMGKRHNFIIIPSITLKNLIKMGKIKRKRNAKGT